MIYIVKKILPVIIACLFSNFCYSQLNEIKIKFIGNCGLHLTDNNSNFYIDFPYKSGAHNYMEYDEAEIDSIKDNAIFIFTHRHADHYSEKILKKLKGQKFDPWNITELEKLGESIPDFNIKAFETKHKVFGISFRHYSYLITWHNKKIYISGDTENADTIATQKDIDIAFVPVWLLTDAIQKGLKLSEQIKKFAIYHIGQKDNITLDSESKFMLLDKQGEILKIEY